MPAGLVIRSTSCTRHDPPRRDCPLCRDAATITARLEHERGECGGADGLRQLRAALASTRPGEAAWLPPRERECEWCVLFGETASAPAT